MSSRADRIKRLLRASALRNPYARTSYYPRTHLSSYGTMMYPQQAMMPLVGSGRRYPTRMPMPMRPRPSVDMFGGTSYYGTDVRSLSALENLMQDIEDEMYSQEDKANRTCVEGQETANYRYQAMNDLLADANDVFEDARMNGQAYGPEDLANMVSTFRGRLGRAKNGRLSDFDPSMSDIWKL